MLIERTNSQLIVIDMQDKLVQSIPGNEDLCACAMRLVDAASLLHVPISLTEHCSDKIGSTIAPLRSRFTSKQIIQKRHFSACKESSFEHRMHTVSRPQVILCGMEAHVCVLQTALQLQSRGFSTYIVDDATGSQDNANKNAAFQRAQPFKHNHA